MVISHGVYQSASVAVGAVCICAPAVITLETTHYGGSPGVRPDLVGIIQDP